MQFKRHTLGCNLKKKKSQRCIIEAENPSFKFFVLLHANHKLAFAEAISFDMRNLEHNVVKIIKSIYLRFAFYQVI